MGLLGNLSRLLFQRANYNIETYILTYKYTFGQGFNLYLENVNKIKIVLKNIMLFERVLFLKYLDVWPMQWSYL